MGLWESESQRTDAEVLAAVESESGRDISDDGDKLDGIETGATADQTDTEILTAVESESGRDMSADGDKLDVLQPVLTQAINMTAATSGSNGIQVANNDDINLGTGDFSLVWIGSLPDWISDTTKFFMYRFQDSNNEIFFVLRSSSGSSPSTLQIGAKIDGSFLINSPSSQMVPEFDNNSIHMLVASASRGEGIKYFIDNVLFDEVTLTADAGTLDYTCSVQFSGYPGVRSASTTKAVYLFNRALSSDDVADLYANGLAVEDMGASQTPVYESDFSSGVDSWNLYDGIITGNIDDIAGESDCLSFYANTANGLHGVYKSINAQKNIRLKVSCKIYMPSTNTNLKGIYINFTSDGSGVDGNNIVYTRSIPLLTSDEWVTVEGDVVLDKDITRLTIRGNTGEVNNYAFAGSGIETDDLFYIKDVVISKLGCTLALEPESIQPSPGQWLDSSGNGHHAKMPAEGCTLMRPQRDGIIEWTNTWAASSAGQYIGGINEDLLPEEDIRIEWVRIETETTGVNVTIGDQTDTDRFVEATALSNELDVSSPAHRNHDGTNRKLVITPSGTYTGSVKTTIKYTIV